MCKLLFLVVFSISLSLITAENSQARKVSSSKVYKTSGNPKYAAFLVDSDTGKILHQENADSTRHPASLTKMMTLYLTFEALRAGKLKWNEKMPISREAASRPQTNLSLKAGEKIRVRDAVLALIIRSANDAAVVLAERLGGTEANFAKTMTARAKQLGMKNTVFRNASGLHDPKQVTTAKDMALLGIALKKHYKEYYHYFSRTQFVYNGKTYKSHNRVLTSYAGADGLKTGYVNASGFNLVTSAKRGRDNVVGVVLGGRSGKTRDAKMMSLLDEGFMRMASLRSERVQEIATLSMSAADAPYPVSKNYAEEGGYEAYIEEKSGAGAPVASEAQYPQSIKSTLANNFVPYPLDKPRFLAQR